MEDDFKRYKCPSCGWVHAAIPESEAKVAVDNALSFERAQGLPETASLESYLRCFSCGEPTAKFVPARQGEVPSLATLQCVIVPGAFD